MVDAGSTVAVRSMWGWGQFLAQVGGQGWMWGPNGGGDHWHTGVAVGVTVIAGLALAFTILIFAQRGGLKSPWSGRKRKNPLRKQEWQSFFTPEDPQPSLTGELIGLDEINPATELVAK